MFKWFRNKESALKCKSTFESESYVVNHITTERNLVFCLNCDDLITIKEEVLKSDVNRDLMRDI